MKTVHMPFRTETEIVKILNDAKRKTGLPRSEVIRQALLIGVPIFIKRLRPELPQIDLADHLRNLKGVEIPKRQHFGAPRI